MEKVTKRASVPQKRTDSRKSPDGSATRRMLDAMSFDSEALLSAAGGLADDLESGRKLTRHHVSVRKPDIFQPGEIVAIRKSLGMSQAVFASVIGVTPASVMNWEYGRRTPSGPVCRLLRIAAKTPEVLLESV